MFLSSLFTKKCADVFGKILQILVIAAMALLVVVQFIDIGLNFTTSVAIFVIVYILFLISQFCSTTCSFLCHKTNEMGIKQVIGNLVQTPPTIEFYCECYHFETYTTISSPPKKGGSKKSGGKKGHSRGGNVGKRGGGHHHRVTKHTRKVTTWRETAYFPYYSARDVSGLFELNNSREAAMGKVYIKLELTPEINFADELSYMDYENFRSDFYNRNRVKDQYMDYKETRSVKGLNQFNFVCIRNQEPCGINICMFILFTIIPLTELYKCYVNSYCLDQQFKIRKLISTRYDLNQQEQYQYLIPSFNVPDQQYAFEPSNYNYINNDYNVQQPTNDEISRASTYKDKIPKYECVSYTSINDQIKVGVVQDDPAFCSANICDAPPPNCQDIGPQSGSNNMNMNLNMNMNNIDSRNNFNVNYNNNVNMNQDDDEDSEDEGGPDMPYSGGK